MIAHVCLRHKFVDLGVMAPDLLRWGDDLISEPADYTDDSFDDELNGVSDSDDVGARTTPKGSFLLIYRSVLSVTTTQNRTNLLVAPNRDLVKSKRKGRQDDSKRRFEIYTLHKFHKM